MTDLVSHLIHLLPILYSQICSSYWNVFTLLGGFWWWTLPHLEEPDHRVAQCSQSCTQSYSRGASHSLSTSTNAPTSGLEHDWTQHVGKLL